MKDAKIQKPRIDTLFNSTKVVKLCPTKDLYLTFISYVEECLFVCSKTLF